MSDQRGNRTEKATLRKRKQAREKGNVLKSTDVNTAVMLLAVFAALKIFGGGMVTGVSRLLSVYLESSGVWDTPLMVQDIKPIISGSIKAILETVVPVLATAMLAAVFVNFLQVGFHVSAKSMGWKMSRLNPLQGIKRMFTARSLAELVKAMLKIALIGYMIYGELIKCIDSLPSLMLQDVAGAASTMMDTVTAMLFKISIVLLILAIGDYLFQWWQREKDLKMTKQEIKDEMKLLEGDPQIKGRLRQKQRQMGLLRTMQELKKADVVIANPTHYAVALKYDEQKDGVPVVVAKGADYLAKRIKKEAAAIGIEIVENKPLAVALYKSCGIGDKIPVEMYRAVAEILAYIYRLKQKSVIHG